jgi:hypothetical protein
MGSFERNFLGLLRSITPGAKRGWSTSEQSSLSGPRSTIFDDRALRVRNLTVEPVQSLDDGQSGVFKIRLARSDEYRERAGELVDRRYAWRGYEAHGISVDPKLFTFAAFDRGEVVGTVSVRLDSEKGLAADAAFSSEIDQLRGQGYRLCEYTRLAVDSEARSKFVLGSLFHTVWMFAHQVCGCTHGIVEVNPRHTAFYRRSVLFRTLGDQRHNDSVNAPAVLLLWEHELIPPQLRLYAGRPELASTTRLIFPHWFGEQDAGGILERLRALYRSRTS